MQLFWTSIFWWYLLLWFFALFPSPNYATALFLIYNWDNLRQDSWGLLLWLLIYPGTALRAKEWARTHGSNGEDSSE